MPVKLCMVGVRGHNDYVLTGLPQTDVEVAGLCAATGDDVGDLQSRCQQLGHQPQIYGDPRQMLDELRPDLVSIAGPFEQQAQLCVEAFRRGQHVFCEKPVALTLEQLDTVAAERQQAGVHLAAMMGLRYDPAFFCAWKAVQEGAVGQLRLLNTQKSYRLGRRRPYYHERATYGGTIPWVGSHAVDWVQWFTAGRAFESVYATHTPAHNSDHGDLEASALCHFTLADDVYASVSLDYLRPAAAPSHGDDRIRVVGTEGILEVCAGEVKLIAADGERRLTPSCDRQIFADFVAHITGETEALIGPEDTIAVTRACLLARESADTGKVVRFP
jgi:predicted dehydrogenase